MSKFWPVCLASPPEQMDDEKKKKKKKQAEYKAQSFGGSTRKSLFASIALSRCSH